MRVGGCVLDAGCGGGGTALSLAEESSFAVGLDLEARFAGSGTRLASEKGIANVAFVQGDGVRLPFQDATFDLVFSHSVIEHVTTALGYLRECHRVLRPGGVLYLSTAPTLSLAGAHLPRLLVPVPVHILLGGGVLCLFRGCPHAPAPAAPEEANLLALAEQGKAQARRLRSR